MSSKNGGLGDLVLISFGCLLCGAGIATMVLDLFWLIPALLVTIGLFIISFINYH